MASKPKITLKNLTEDDLAWVRAQSEALGLDDDGLMICMLVRDARKKGLSFSMVASDPNARVIVAPPPRWFESSTFHDPGNLNPSVTAYQNEPPQDFDFPDSPETQPEPALAAEPADDIAATLDQGLSAIDAMIAHASQSAPAPQQPSRTYRSNTSRLRTSTHLSRGNVVPFDGPGSRTMAIGAGHLGAVDIGELLPKERVMRQNNAHFFGRG